MAKQTPFVCGNQLYLPDNPQPVCQVDSAFWFAWLETVPAFRYQSDQRLNVIRGYGPLLSPVSFRREQRRQQSLWYAYRRGHGILHKRYAGKSSTLTADKLAALALMLNLV